MPTQLQLFGNKASQASNITAASNLASLFYKQCYDHYNHRAIFTSGHCYLARQKVYKEFLNKYDRAILKKVKLIKKILDNLEFKASQRVNGPDYTPPIRF